jgi:hypothetical protein
VLVKKITSNFLIKVNGSEVLNGCTLAEVTTLVTQTVGWMVLILQVWTKGLPSAKKMKQAAAPVIH